MFDTITCPECGYVATVLERFHLASTEGPVEHLSTSCINGVLSPRTTRQRRQSSLGD